MSTTSTTTMSTTNTTTTETRPRGRQPARGGLDAGWKSAFLVASLGAVALGWSLLGRAEGLSTAQMAMTPQAIAAQAPAAIQAAATDGRVVLAPALPQRPVFTQPVTRSRAS